MDVESRFKEAFLEALVDDDLSSKSVSSLDQDVSATTSYKLTWQNLKELSISDTYQEQKVDMNTVDSHARNSQPK